MTSTGLLMLGGHGGDGSTGGNGGPGAPGAAGVVQTERGSSVRGRVLGPTRYGGTGGAGGNGGPHIYVALIGTGSFTPTGTIRYHGGRPGNGGAGGLDTSGTYRAAPGQSGVSATCITLTLGPPKD